MVGILLVGEISRGVYFLMPQAMILAAGRGERLRPMTDHCPKPLIEVQGKPLLEWHIQALHQAGFGRIVVNGAWLVEQLADFIGDGRRWGGEVYLSREAIVLGTAGGVRQALPYLTASVFALVSADIFTDYDYRRLKQCCDQGLRGRDQAHLVLVNDVGYLPDFYLDEEGRVGMVGEQGGTYGNMGVFRREFFYPQGSAELGPCLRQAVVDGQVTGEWSGAQWVNVGTEQERLRAGKLKLNRGR